MLEMFPIVFWHEDIDDEGNGFTGEWEYVSW